MLILAYINPKPAVKAFLEDVNVIDVLYRLKDKVGLKEAGRQASKLAFKAGYPVVFTPSIPGATLDPGEVAFPGIVYAEATSNKKVIKYVLSKILRLKLEKQPEGIVWVVLDEETMPESKKEFRRYLESALVHEFTHLKQLSRQKLFPEGVPRGPEMSEEELKKSVKLRGVRRKVIKDMLRYGTELALQKNITEVLVFSKLELMAYANQVGEYICKLVKGEEVDPREKAIASSPLYFYYL